MTRRRIIKKFFDSKLILSSCFYILDSKFDVNTYIKWMKNFIKYVKNFKLIIYCHQKSYQIIKDLVKDNPNIKIIIKEIEEFYLYKYKDYFIKNHQINELLKNKIEWKLNLLWCEKCFFVKDTIDNNYFQGNYFGWCDIGYFRTKTSKGWPGKLNLEDKIYYNSISNYKQVKKINKAVDPTQNSICGGFFIAKKEKSLWWTNKFEEKLKYYIDNNLLIKDDQTLIVDCLQEDNNNFKILLSKDWFYFIDFLT